MLNLYDVIVSSVIMTCFFSGLRQGAVRLILGNISFILSILLSFVLFPASLAVVGEYIESQTISFGLASCISYIISLILCSVFFSKIKLIIKPVCGGLVDKSAGSMFGILNGLLLSLLVFIVAAFFSAPRPLDDHQNLYDIVSAAKHDNYPKWLKDSSSFSFMKDSLVVALRYPRVISMLKKADLLDISFIEDIGKIKDKSHKIDHNLELELGKILDGR
jgi:membrane protein required for colicin V production